MWEILAQHNGEATVVLAIVAVTILGVTVLQSIRRK